MDGISLRCEQTKYGTPTNLTVGRTYGVLGVNDDGFNIIYLIKDDNSEKKWYGRYWFTTLADRRNDKLEKLLYGKNN